MLGWTALQTALGFLPAALIVAFGSPRKQYDLTWPLAELHLDRLGRLRLLRAAGAGSITG